MEEQRIKGYIADFLDGFDDSRFPAGFLRDYEAEECLGNSRWNETLLVKNRTTGAYAVAKCYDVQLLGGCSEADLLRKLHHPALPTLIATYENGGMLCVVREYVAGVTLAEAAVQKPFTEAETIDIGLQLANVLTYLHTQTPPIIHRDIKPENIILRDDGTVALIDFGISRTFDKDAKNDTQRLGTASFAPPEQYGFAQTDCRSDIFSLGMVLGFLLTQRTELAEMQGDISDRALARIVKKCTAFAPKERYASASELARALRAAQPGQRKRRRALSCVLGAVLVAGVALAAVLLPGAQDGRVVDDDADLTGEAFVTEAADYLNGKYHTDLFSDSADIANVGYVRSLLTGVYGYDEDYATARPAASPPTETEDSFLPWNFADAETPRLDEIMYIVVKIYWPDVVADWSSLTDDDGEYPGIRVAKPFAEEKGVYAHVDGLDPITVGDVTAMLYDADRAYGNGLPPQLSPTPAPTAKPASALGFTEPLLEKAARAALGKSETDPVSTEEFASVEGLYVFANAVSADADGFYASAGDWYASGSGKKGDIASLADVALLPNLRVVCIAAQRITDLSPLASLPLIEKVELKHNRISDVSVLSLLPLLVSVGLNDNPATDLSPLTACQNLRFLDLCDTQGYDPSFLDALGDFEFLDLANATDSYKHLGSRRVRDLRLGYSGLDSLSWLSHVTGLETLEVKHSKLTSLEGIEAHAALTHLNIAGCPVGDLTPVLALPNLETLVLSEDMRALSDALGETPFSVSFE